MNLFTRLLVNFAFFLEGSPFYKKTKKFFYDLLENSNYKYKKYFDYTMIVIILSSVAIIIEETEHPLYYWLNFYDIYIVTTIFIIEYLLRLWVYVDRRKIVIEEFENSVFLESRFNTKRVLLKIWRKTLQYIFSPFAIIDLLAILPAYRELRILRIFVLFRAFKIFRYSKNLVEFLDVLTSKRTELTMLFFLVLFIVFISGASLYVFEAKTNPNVHSLLDAFYWSFVTISTVGYGDITPTSNEARIFTVIIILAGLGLISFFTSIIVSSFTEKIDEIKESKVLSKVEQLNDFYLICGYSHLAELVAQKLKSEKREFVIIEQDPKKYESIQKRSYLAIKEDASKREVLERINLKNRVKAVMCLAQDDIHNIFIALNIRSLSKSIPIISRTFNKNSYKKLKLAGVDYIVSPYETAGLIASKILSQPIAIEAVINILSKKKNAVCDETEVLKNSFLENIRIKDIDLDKYKLILLGVRRIDENGKKFHFNPSGNFILKSGDLLIIMGYSISVSHFKSLVIESSLTHARKKR